MKTKRVAIKVYLEAEDEIYKRVEFLASKTTLSLSSVAGMALRYGLPSVEQTMKKLFEDDPSYSSYDEAKSQKVQSNKTKRKPVKKA